MNLFQKAVAALTKRPLSLTDPKGWPADHPSDTGEPVTADSVLGLSSVWACINLLAGTTATLPLMVYKIGAKGERVVDRDHPLYRVLHDSPNADQTAVDFWEFMSASVELWGNAYAMIERSGSRIVSLTPIRPNLVVTDRKESGAIRYRWSEDGTYFEKTDADILHIRGFGGSPLGGMSTLTFGRQVFGLSLAINKAASTTFRNGMRPAGQIVLKEFMTPEQREQFDEKIAQKFVGAINAGRPFIGEGGMEWKSITLNPEDAQMLESRGFSVTEICQLFGVPPFMIGYTEKSTSWGAGLEQQTLGFVKFTLRRRLKRIEMAAQKQLLTPADRAAGVTIEFSLEGLLRGDSAGRSAFYNAGLQNGWLTINEVRALENLPRVDGGDVPRMQMQNVPITEAGSAPAIPPRAGEPNLRVVGGGK